MSLRREFDLTADHAAFLDRSGLPWETIVDGSRWLLLHGLKTGNDRSCREVTAALRVRSGAPRIELAFVYVFPPLEREGTSTAALRATQQIDGKIFQCWPRP